ncbi:MAG TPA: DMT family transporter [Candidatus Binatia bacterium]|nr:DMT family transporter [Candidatus Binatia bacterium]
METGVVYALCAGVFWGTSPVLVKRGLAGADVSAATLYQQATILVTLCLSALVEGDLFAGKIPGDAVLIFAGTGIVGAYIGRTLFVKSVDQIGASRAQSLNNSSPLITVLLAAVALGERLSFAVLLGVMFIISGVFFVTQSNGATGNNNPQRRITLAAVLATLCYGVVPVLKKIGTDHGGPPVLGALVMHATGLMLLMTLGNLLKIERKWQRIPMNSLGCFVGAGFLYAIGSIFTLKALVHAPASVVAPIWSAQPIVSFFLAKTTLKGIEEVTFRDGAAAALVVLGVLVLRLG